MKKIIEKLRGLNSKQKLVMAAAAILAVAAVIIGVAMSRGAPAPLKENNSFEIQVTDDTNHYVSGCRIWIECPGTESGMMYVTDGKNPIVFNSYLVGDGSGKQNLKAHVMSLPEGYETADENYVYDIGRKGGEYRIEIIKRT